MPAGKAGDLTEKVEPPLRTGCAACGAFPDVVAWLSMRIVSLLPSATELLYAVGAGDALVGRSPHCDWPIEVLETPIADKSLGDLKPDLVLGPKGCGETLSGCDATVIEFNPTSIFDVFDDCLRIGKAVGCEEDAEQTMVALRSRYWSAVDFVNPYVPGPAVLFLEWLEPLRVGGLWTPTLIENAGAQPALTTAGAPSRLITHEEIIAAKPDRIVVAPCSYNLETIGANISSLFDQGWCDAVEIVDGMAMFNRPGPRLVDSFEWLVGWINNRPELIPAGFPARSMRKDALS